MNVWDEAAVLPMAIRLRKAGKCPGDVDNLYGEIMQGIVHMASVLLPKEDPRYACHLDDFLTEDVQSAMLLQALTAAEKYVDTMKKPRKIVNYLIKTVQNRLRNWVRDTENRENKLELVMECELGCGMDAYAVSARGLEGQLVDKDRCRKVCTDWKDFT